MKERKELSGEKKRGNEKVREMKGREGTFSSNNRTHVVT